ncbi:MAG: hypothetical protein R3C55_04740 [Parvularculaceae bacterium]
MKATPPKSACQLIKAEIKPISVADFFMADAATRMTVITLRNGGDRR